MPSPGWSEEMRMAVRPERRITYEDYLHFPDGERWEVIDGEAFMVPSPNEKHQRILLELVYMIRRHLKIHGGGRVYMAPFDVVLDPKGDIVQPDVVYVDDADADVITEANIWGRPSWVIEVLSPAHPERDRRLKLQRYERFGVPEYWIVDPAGERVEVYLLDDGSYGTPTVHERKSSVSPGRPEGLEVDLDEIFGA